MLSTKIRLNVAYFGGGRKFRKRAFCPWENFRRYTELEIVPPEEGKSIPPPLPH